MFRSENSVRLWRLATVVACHAIGRQLSKQIFCSMCTNHTVYCTVKHYLFWLQVKRVIRAEDNFKKMLKKPDITNESIVAAIATIVEEVSYSTTYRTCLNVPCHEIFNLWVSQNRLIWAPDTIFANHCELKETFTYFRASLVSFFKVSPTFCVFLKKCWV